MGDKAEQKKQYILDTAKKVFVEKGFKRVTMKDIVEACDISRGGLYLYFDNTSQIFLEVLKADLEDSDDSFTAKITEDATAATILIMFLKEQKKMILQKKESLVTATYEFYFENKPEKKDNVVRKQFDASVRIMERLIEAGVENGEFYCEDCGEAARNIMLVMEGLKINAQTIGVTPDMVDKQIIYILTTLGFGEDED